MKIFYVKKYEGSWTRHQTKNQFLKIISNLKSVAQSAVVQYISFSSYSTMY